MGGFLLNLKNKVQKPSKPGNRLTKRANVGNLASLKNLLDDDRHEESSTKTSIDAFLEKGAMAGETHVNERKTLVIKPQSLSSGIVRRKKGSFEKKDESNNIDESRASLLEGESVDDTGLVILGDANDTSEPTEQDYGEVPVDQFGAALLRGMGWDGREDVQDKKDISHRQRGTMLGIGSKPLDEDVEKDIMGDKRTKLLVPLKIREK